MKPSIESVEKAKRVVKKWGGFDTDLEVLIAEAIEEARQEMREEAAKCAYDFCPKTLGLNHKVSQAILNLS